MLVTEAIRTQVRQRIQCPCCGHRIMTVNELTAAMEADAAKLDKPPKVTPAIVSGFLRGEPVRSDVLDLFELWCNGTPAAPAAE